MEAVAASRAPKTRHFARDGFCIIRGALDAATVGAFIEDAASRAAAASDSTICEPPASLYHPARQSTDAYLRLRAQSTNIGSEQASRIARALFSTLPSCAAEASGWSEPNGGGDGDWRLMHEAYIVKPPHGGSHYLWHRDCDRHLWCAEGVDNTAALDQPPGLAHVARDGAPPEGESAELYAAELYARPPLRAAVPYLTVWTALSRTSRQNGTLVLLPAQTASHAADSGGGAARRRGAPGQRGTGCGRWTGRLFTPRRVSQALRRSV